MKNRYNYSSISFICLFGMILCTFYYRQEGKKMRDLVRLICEECKEENYYTDKNKRLNPERIEFKKYCPRCRKHTTHKEKK